jgi:hypothetical protein
MYALDVESLPDERAGVADQGLLAAERQRRAARGVRSAAAERQAADLPAHRGPPLPYADISAQLGIPVGSIGPNRSRYLDKMRRHPAIAALINA